MTKALHPMEKLTPVVNSIFAAFRFQGVGSLASTTMPVRLMLRGLLDGLALSGDLPVCEMRVIESATFLGSVRVYLDFADGTKGEFHIKSGDDPIPQGVESLMQRVSTDVEGARGRLCLVPPLPTMEPVAL